MNRVSSYLIDVEIKSTGEHMLVHGYTGAIDVVSKEIAMYLHENSSQIDKEVFPFSNSTWEKLNKRGYVTSKTENEEIDTVRKMADLFHTRNKNLCKNFGFIVSYNCNFRCPYCYQSRISDFGNKWSTQTFSTSMVDNAFKAMNTIGPVHKCHNKSICLYGGEPLLSENFEIVKYIVEKGSGLGYTFSVITNGYNLEDFESLLSPDKIREMQITIDGSKETHNKTRIHENGSDTFTKIVRNIKLVLQKGVTVRIRMNCNHENISEIAELRAVFEKEGYFNYPSFSFYCALINDYLKEFKNHNCDAANVNFMERKTFVNLHDEKYEYSFEDEGFTKRILDAVKKGHGYSLNSIYCGAFSSTYMFDPYGRIYACWEKVGQTDLSIGSYDANSVTYTEQLKKFHNHNVAKMPKCVTCKYVFVCKGGCPSKNHNHHCSNLSKIFEISVNKAYLRMQK